MEKKKRPITDEAQNCQINQWETISIVFKLGWKLCFYSLSKAFSSRYVAWHEGVWAENNKQEPCTSASLPFLLEGALTHVLSLGRPALGQPASHFQNQVTVCVFADRGGLSCFWWAKTITSFCLWGVHLFIHPYISACFLFRLTSSAPLFLIRTIFHSPPVRPPSPSDFPVWYLL